MTTEARPCCAVGRRPDAAEIDAALRAGVPYRQVAMERGCPELASAIYRHSKHLSVEGSTPVGAGVAPASAPRPASVSVKQVPKQPEASEAERAPTSSHIARASQHPRPSATSARPLPEQVEDQSAEHAQRLTADRLRTVATLIASDGWKPELHVHGLAQRWGIAEHAVRRLHALAALRVKSDRGTLTAQREEAVARVKAIIREELAAAKMYEQAARDAFEQAASADRGSKLFSPAPAKWAKMLAGMCRATAIQAEKFLATITYQRPKDPTAILNVSFSTHPDFVRAAEIQRLILDAIAPPGLAARVDEAFALWEQGGDAALEEWRREQLEAGSLLLTQGDDGSFGEAAAS